MIKSVLAYKRKSYIQTGELFFWTATINQWQRLLYKEAYKEVIISSLTYLSSQHKIEVFAFVIMPNHIHLIWRINESNGKETPQASLLKYTAHQFKKMIKEEAGDLAAYRVHAVNKQYEFWQRDSLAVSLYTKAVAMQKLDYIHYNPVADHWRLAADPCAYKYSSARYYEMNEKEFSFLRDLRKEF